MSDAPFRPRYITLFWPTAVTAALAMSAMLVIGMAANDDTASEMPLEVSVATAVLLLSTAWLVCKLIDVFFWEAVVQRRTSVAPPRLLVDLVRLLVVLIFASIIVLVIWGEEKVRPLLLSSGVVGIIIGFALQRMIGDFFSGIALNIERPFRIGDWISIDDTAGRVIEINWRATHLVTLDNISVIMPNSEIAAKRVLNYNQPGAPFRTEVPVTLEYAVPHDQAKRALLAAIRATEGVLETPAPDVVVRAFGNDGVEYRCRFYIDTYDQINTVPDRVADSISRHIWQAGFAVPYPKRDVYHDRMPPRHVDRSTDRDILLQRVSLFASLSEDQLRQLAARLVVHEVTPGQSVITQGQPGDSLYVIVEGLFDAYVSTDDLAPQRVGRLHPGEFFGENAMLTGGTRAATVTAVTAATVYELHRDTLADFLQSHQEFAAALSDVLAARRLRTDKALASPDIEQQQTDRRTLAQDLLKKMRYYLGLT
jgi:small-conductance mechanosensitive channel/CRP-like cAMP-binding protein